MSIECLFNRKNITREVYMSEQKNDEQIPAMQKLLDSPFILTAIGIILPTIFYTVWGVVEVLLLPHGYN
jgi:hypothetical protein